MAPKKAAAKTPAASRRRAKTPDANPFALPPMRGQQQLDAVLVHKRKSDDHQTDLPPPTESASSTTKKHCPDMMHGDQQPETASATSGLQMRTRECNVDADEPASTAPTTMSPASGSDAITATPDPTVFASVDHSATLPPSMPSASTMHLPRMPVAPDQAEAAWGVTP
jgi:hypothetical protein